MNNMSVESLIDLDELLQPIAADNPAGESLRYEGTYDRITYARREDDPALSQGIYKSAVKRSVSRHSPNAAKICKSPVGCSNPGYIFMGSRA
jgi:hypothetical protein